MMGFCQQVTQCVHTAELETKGPEPLVSDSLDVTYQAANQENHPRLGMPGAMWRLILVAFSDNVPSFLSLPDLAS